MLERKPSPTAHRIAPRAPHEEAAVAEVMRDLLHSARFGPDGTILTAGQDGRARIWFDPAQINAWLSSPEREVYRLSCADQQELGLGLEGCP